MVSSIKKFLSPDFNLRDAYGRALSMIVHGIGTHAVTSDESYRLLLCRELDLLYEGLGDAPTPKALVDLASAVNKTVEKYNQETGAGIRAQSAELQKIVTMLAGSVKTLSHGSERSVNRLQTIEKKIERACGGDDIRELKKGLQQCLTDLRQETAQQKRDSTDSLAELRGRLDDAHVQISRSVDKYSTTDPVTGLAGREEAQQKLTYLMQAGGQFQLALFTIERLELINGRYGPAAGDDVLLFLCRRLSEGFTTKVCLYRCGLAEFVAVFENGTSEHEIRTVVGRLFPARIECNIKVGERSVMLPISSRWVVMPANESADMHILTRKMEAFFSAG